MTGGIIHAHPWTKLDAFFRRAEGRDGAKPVPTASTEARLRDNKARKLLVKRVSIAPEPEPGRQQRRKGNLFRHNYVLNFHST
jgi:hypothetical protein